MSEAFPAFALALHAYVARLLGNIGELPGQHQVAFAIERLESDICPWVRINLNQVTDLQILLNVAALLTRQLPGTQEYAARRQLYTAEKYYHAVTCK